MCDTSSHVFVVINIIPEGGAHGSFFCFYTIIWTLPNANEKVKGIPGMSGMPLKKESSIGKSYLKSS
jgi:hypothetical protein